VSLLQQAGARVTAADLLHAVDRRSAPGLAALLPAGRPAVDTSQPAQTCNAIKSYSCPVHRALHAVLSRQRGRPRADKSACHCMHAACPRW
jgi:hypothetical protein